MAYKIIIHVYVHRGREKDMYIREIRRHKWNWVQGGQQQQQQDVRKEIIICDICLEKQINIARSKQQHKKT